MKVKISKISALHYFKLVFRSMLFLGLLGIYIYDRCTGGLKLFSVTVDKYHIFILGVWLIFIVEMLLRFAPNQLESMGCQKIFQRNYKPVQKHPLPYKGQNKKGRTIALIFWLTLNSIIGILYFTKIFDYGILILISSAFSICDMICILFFCPFQTWMIKNKCCGSCPIYNWDFAMMFTPFVFIPNAYTWSLLLISILLVAQWEITYREKPERFSEATNDSLKCVNCKEKLCSHKKQLQSFLKTIRNEIPLVKDIPMAENKFFDDNKAE